MAQLRINRLPILTFHDVGGESSVISVSPALFCHGLKVLTKSGFATAKLSKIPGWLQDGFPKKTAVVTFDDGHHGVFRHAFPELSERGQTATVFLSVGDGPHSAHTRLPSIAGRTMLSWAEIREMARYGIEFGAHTCSHPDLTRLRDEQARVEIRKSKEIIEDALGCAVTTFAYPFGRWNRTARHIVSEFFACSCTDRLGFVRAHDDRYTLGRIDSYYLRRKELFDLFPTVLMPWYVLARAVPRSIRRSLMVRLGT